MAKNSGKKNEKYSGGKSKQDSSKQSLPIWMYLTGLAVIIIAGIFVFGAQDQTVPASDSSVSILRSIGPETAPVTITEYADFGCTSCKAWHQFGIKQKIIDKYGEQVRFVWRDFPVITSDSPKAAEAGFCAHDQGKFWQYHDVVYENAPALSIGNLKTYAAETGLDTEKFNQCLDSGQHTADVDVDLQDALGRGFRGVPTFLVNGDPLIGPPSFEQLSSIIDSHLQ